MIKVKLESLGSEYDIEIKENNSTYNLIVIKSKNEFYKETGKVWHAETKDSGLIKEMETLLETSIASPTKSTRITICDGILVTFDCEVNGRKIQFAVRDFEPDTAENNLMIKLFEFCNLHTNETIFLKNGVWF